MKQSKIIPDNSHPVNSVPGNIGRKIILEHTILAIAKMEVKDNPDLYDDQEQLNNMGRIYQTLLEEVLGASQSDILNRGCTQCDPRVKKLLNITKYTIAASLSKQLQFRMISTRPPLGAWYLERDYNRYFAYLGDFKKPSYNSCTKISNKLTKLPLCAREVNYKIASEFKLGNLMTLRNWEKENKSQIKQAVLKHGEITQRFSPHLLVVNPNSQSTPIRLCTVSNAPEQTKTTDLDKDKDIPSRLSYNDSVRKYPFEMPLNPISYAIQSSVCPPLLIGDISRAFLTLNKTPLVALSELEYYYTKQDGYQPSWLLRVLLEYLRCTLGTKPVLAQATSQ